MTWQGALRIATRKATYLFQRVTGTGVDPGFERDLRSRASDYMSAVEAGTSSPHPVKRQDFNALDLDDTGRFRVIREDIYKRFLADDGGADVDEFGRRGHWIPRGCMIYYDNLDRTYVKVFDSFFCSRGEGRFLPDAFKSGAYDFLCPGLSSVLVDEEGAFRGYIIREGRQLTPYEFDRYVSGGLREVICEITRQTGLYFNDLAFHNVILVGDELSLIDLESILPVVWYGKDLEFARKHLSDVDIGWPLQSKWKSPGWYASFLRSLQADI